MGELRTDLRPTRKGECGCFCCKTPCLQPLSHVNSFMVVFSGIFILSLSVAGYLAGVVSTLEKRFQLTSSEVGALTTVSSIVSLSLVVFLAYYGQTKHRPRLIAIGALFVGVGAILMSFPQFLYGTPPFLTVANDTGDSQETELCNAGAETSTGGYNSSSCTDADGTTSSSYGIAWLIMGQVLIGIGGSAFVPLAITFIDDNVEKTSTALYVGILFASTGIAPIVGFGLSSICLSYYTDFYKSSSSLISTDDNNWLGAWWLGFVIYGVSTLALSVPMFMFPKRISEYLEDEDDDDKVADNVVNDDLNDMLNMTVYRPTALPTDEKPEKCGAVKGFLSALGRIVTNPAYVIVVFGVCLTFAAISGFFTFGPKYIETQYDVSTSVSPLILGGMVAPGAIIGNFLGGYLVKRLKLDVMGFAKMILLITIPVTVVTPVIFFLGCDNPDIAGLTTDYRSMDYDVNTYNTLNNDDSDVSSPVSSCNSQCQCPSIYSPVCGSDGITYVSPCYARCTEVSEDVNNRTIYLDCGCVAHANATENEVTQYSAQKGECSRKCDNLWLFTGVFLIIFFFNCIMSNPAFMLYLRIVDPKDRSIAVGLASLALKVLGFIPAPIFYGKAIQTTCLLSWQLSCEETGACLIHDIRQFRFNFLGLTYGLLVLFTLCMVVGYFAVKRHMKGFRRVRVVTIERSSRNHSQPRGGRLPSSFFIDTSNGNGHKAVAV